MLTGEKSLSERNEDCQETVRAFRRPGTLLRETEDDSCKTEQSYDERDANASECLNEYATPSPIMHHEKMREINIREVNKGFILNIGCHTFAFTKTSDFIPELTKYLTNPQETEKDWFSGDLFKQ